MCICVFVYLTVGNISFDVLGPWAFQKYSIIRFYKVFWAWWRTNKQPGEPRASLRWTLSKADFCNSIIVIEFLKLEFGSDWQEQHASLPSYYQLFITLSVALSPLVAQQQPASWNFWLLRSAFVWPGPMSLHLVPWITNRAVTVSHCPCGNTAWFACEPLIQSPAVAISHLALRHL